MNQEDYRSFALELVAAARDQTLGRFARGCEAQDKSGGGDFDPVTDADREAERAMREMVEAHFPEHGIAGEEFPDRPAQGRYCWSLDPVDGTRSFTCSLPTWTTLIALLEDGLPVLGVIDAPCLDELCIGYGGTASLLSNRVETPLRVSSRTALAEARFSTTDPFLFSGREQEAFQRLRTAVRTTRYGHDAYGYARLAAGGLDLVVENSLKPHDYNALIPVVRGAGGEIGDWTGGSDFSAGKIIAAATPELFEQAVAVMRDAA